MHCVGIPLVLHFGVYLMYTNSGVIFPYQRARIKENKRSAWERDCEPGYIQRFRFPSEPYIFTTKGNDLQSADQHYGR